MSDAEARASRNREPASSAASERRHDVNRDVLGPHRQSKDDPCVTAMQPHTPPTGGEYSSVIASRVPHVHDPGTRTP
jgi:hypothetical protein